MFLPRQSLALLDPLQWPDHTDEQRAIYKSTIRFVEHSIKPNLQRWEQEGMLPRSLHREAGTLGLTGLGFPEALGVRRPTIGREPWSPGDSVKLGQAASLRV